MMGMTLVAQGPATALADMVTSPLAEGARAELRLFTQESLSTDAVAALGERLRDQGVVLWDSVEQEGRVLSIRFEVHSALDQVASAVSAIPSNGWQLFATTSWATWGLPLLAIGGLLLIFKLAGGSRG